MRSAKSWLWSLLTVGVLGAVVATTGLVLVGSGGDTVRAKGVVVGNPAAPAEWMWLQRANPDGSIPPAAYLDAVAQTRQIGSATRAGMPQLAGRARSPAPRRSTPQARPADRDASSYCKREGVL
jgi:hypothetical protein